MPCRANHSTDPGGPSNATAPNPRRSGFADVNGVRIWYQTYGEGDPLILLHGGFGSVEMFGPNIAALAAHRKVIGIDLQAHGGTGPLGRPMSFEAMATDVAELIKSLGYEKADVMGYSLGGAVALRVAIDHPEVVDRLVTVSAAYAFSNWHDYNFDGMKSISADPEGTAKGMIGSPMYADMRARPPAAKLSWLDAVKELGGLIGTDYDWSAEVPTSPRPRWLSSVTGMPCASVPQPSSSSCSVVARRTPIGTAREWVKIISR